MRPRTAPSRRVPADSGFTLVEMVVVVAILGVVLATLFGSLTSIVRATASATTKENILDSLRTATQTMTRDLRAADPIELQPVSSDYASDIVFDVYCSAAGSGTCDTSNTRQVEYKVANNSLERVIGSGAGQTTTVLIGPEGPPSVPTALQPGAVVNPANAPVFSYYDATGALLSLSAPPTSFRDCTTVVGIHVAVITRADDAGSTYDLDTRVNLRNSTGMSGC